MDKSGKGHGPRCMICRKFFTPNPRLGDRQRCCGEKKCRQEYKNQWQREKYKSDMQYRRPGRIRRPITREPGFPRQAIRH